MNRLTKRHDDNSGYFPIENIGSESQITLFNYPYHDIENCIDKLGKLEDIEEQIGCPIEVVFKALNNGIYYEKDNITLHCIVDSITNVSLYCDASYYTENYKYSVDIWCAKYSIYLKDYKKTWWLKEDTSE